MNKRERIKFLINLSKLKNKSDLFSVLFTIFTFYIYSHKKVTKLKNLLTWKEISTHFTKVSSPLSEERYKI